MAVLLRVGNRLCPHYSRQWPRKGYKSFNWRTLTGEICLSFRASSYSSSAVPWHEPIHILGAGSLGLLLAASIRLTFPSYPVQLILRKNAQQLDDSKHVVHVTFQQSPDARPQVVVVPVATASSQRRPIRNLIVTTKAFDAVLAIESVKSQLLPNARIVLLGNGVLAVRDELLLQQQGDDNTHDVTLAYTTNGAYRLDPFHVIQAGRGETVVERFDTLAQLLCDINWPTRSVAAIEPLLWLKLAANCVINPLTALHQCRNGDLLLLSHHEWYPIAKEVAAVARALHHPHLDDDQVIAFVTQVIKDTVHNQSSMLQDVLAGRATEIDYLNAYVAQQGQRWNIPCPANEDLCHRIRALTSDRPSAQSKDSKDLKSHE